MADLSTWEGFLRDIMHTLDKGLAMAAGKRLGFCLLVFPFDSKEIEEQRKQGTLGGDYISNADRKDMIAMLRETADRLEKKQDIPVGAEGNA